VNWLYRYKKNCTLYRRNAGKSKTDRERIGEAALELLEQAGPDAVTMRAVAAAAGITRWQFITISPIGCSS